MSANVSEVIMVAGADQLDHDDHRRLLAYWNEKRARRSFPARRDIDPLDLGFMLGRIVLIDVLRDPLRFRMRLHGSVMARRIGQDLTGRFLDELSDPDQRAFAATILPRAVRARRPMLTKRGRTLDGLPHRYQQLHLPLGEDGETVDMLIIGHVYEDGYRG